MKEVNFNEANEKLFKINKLIKETKNIKFHKFRFKGIKFRSVIVLK